MNLMIRNNNHNAEASAKPTTAPSEILSYAIGDSQLGKVLIARGSKGVCSILLGDTDEEVTMDLANRFPRAMRIQSTEALEDDMAKVLRFIEKPAEGLHLALDMRGTPFQRRVWEKLKAIAVGRTVTYKELARWISPLANPRAIAGACAANPIALAIPCHRVVRSDGDLAGYRWGHERKQALIQKEAMA